MLFSKQVFQSMVSGRAFQVAENYLMAHKKELKKQEFKKFSTQLERSRDVNKRKSARRYSFKFQGVKHVPGGTLCQHCGGFANCHDHIIPHAKYSHFPAAAIARICKRLKKQVISVPEFIRSAKHNHLFLCASCNEEKKEREMKVDWTNATAIVRFYFRETRKSPDDTEANIRCDFAKRIADTERKINVARNKGMPTAYLYQRLKGQQSRMHKEIAAAKKS